MISGGLACDTRILATPTPTRPTHVTNQGPEISSAGGNRRISGRFRWPILPPHPIVYARWWVSCPSRPISVETARGKIEALPKNADDTDSVNLFRDAGIKMNFTRQTIDSAPSFTAVISCCAAFPIWSASLISHRPWIGLGDFEAAAILGGGALFDLCGPSRERRPKPRFRYISVNDGAEAITKGLKHAHYIDNLPGNFILRDTSDERVEERRLGAPFGQLFYLAFVFRFAREIRGVPARRPHAGDELLRKTRPDSKSILCLRDVVGAKRLAWKLAKR